MKKYKYISLYIFLGLLISDTLNLKLSGSGGRGNYLPTEPLSWTEIIENLPRSIIAYLIIALFFYFIMKVVIKDNVRYQAEIQKRKTEKCYSAPNTPECRVCGYHNEDYPWGEDGKSPSFQICSCCGVQFGVKDVTPEEIQNERELWVKSKYKWFNPDMKPTKWSFEEQLKNIPKIGNGVDNV